MMKIIERLIAIFSTTKREKPKETIKEQETKTNKDMKPENIKLANNFWLYEFIEGSVMSKKGHEMNWKNIKDLPLEELRKTAEAWQKIRDEWNEKYRYTHNNGREIGVNITSGWRCLDWELYRGRSGKGQHPLGKAGDGIPINVSKELSDKIIYETEVKYMPRVGGWHGGFAVKKPTKTTTGFIHLDTRPDIARWYY